MCEGESITLSISLFATQLLFLYNLFIIKIDWQTLFISFPSPLSPSYWQYVFSLTIALFFTSMTFSSSPSPFFHLCLHHLLFNFISVISSTGASAENLGLYRLHSRETFRRYPYCRYGKFAYSEYIESGDTTFLSFFVEIWLPSYISLRYLRHLLIFTLFL